MKSTDLYDIWIYLWEMYGDPHIPPFPKDILPPVVVASSPDNITPLDASIATIDLVLTIDALDLVQQEPSYLPTLPSCDDFLPTIVGLFLESHIEDVGDIIDNIYLF